MAATREMDVKANRWVLVSRRPFWERRAGLTTARVTTSCARRFPGGRRRRPGSLGIALDWTAWGTASRMATRGSIPEIMKRAGYRHAVASRGPARGIRHALQAGFSGEAVVGHKLGILMEPLTRMAASNPNGSLLARLEKAPAFALRTTSASIAPRATRRAEIQARQSKGEPSSTITAHRRHSRSAGRDGSRDFCRGGLVADSFSSRGGS